MRYALLPDRGLLAISGDDAIIFLQGLITSDARRLEKGEAVYGALLSPQGKFLHDFFLVPAPGKILLDGEKHRLDDLKKRLSLYKLRSKVTIEIVENLQVVAVWDVSGKWQVASGKCVAFPDPRLPELGYRIIGDMKDVPGATPGDYERMRIGLGVPSGSQDLEIDRAIISHYGFEDLHGVDFSKGCYVGQEIIARAKYRGQLKKFLYRVQAKSGVLPAKGTAVLSGETQVGELHSVAGDIGLAVIRVDDADKELRAGEVALTATLPEWVRHKPEGSSAAGK